MLFVSIFIDCLLLADFEHNIPYLIIVITIMINKFRSYYSEFLPLAKSKQ